MEIPQSTPRLETISRQEADRLVRHSRNNAKWGAIGASFVTGFGALGTVLWYKITQDWGANLLAGNLPKYMSQDIDYDKFVISGLALGTIFMACTAGRAIRSLARSREYETNPIGYMKERYGLDLLI